MRGPTGGKAMWNTLRSGLQFLSILTTAIQDIRKRLAPDPPVASDFIDKE